MAFGDPDAENGTGPVGGRTGNESNREGPDYSDPSVNYGEYEDFDNLTEAVDYSPWDSQDNQAAQDAWSRSVGNQYAGTTKGRGRTGNESNREGPDYSAPTPVSGRTGNESNLKGPDYSVDYTNVVKSRFGLFGPKDMEVKDAWAALKDKHSQTQTKNFLGLFDYKGSVHSKHQKGKDVQAFVDKYGKHLDDMGKRNTQAMRSLKEIDEMGKGSPKTGIEGIIEGVMKGINPASMLMGLIGGPFAGIATTLASSIPQYQPTQIEKELEQMQKDLGMIEPDQGDVQIPQHRQIILCNLKPGMRWDVASGSCVPSAADEENPIDTHSPN
ncbi:MAG: hypothetical protein QF577_08145 [Phycisphaerae bacterium]|nr:hypothetical protein [Phycisphaerae bacterium]